MLKWNGGEFQVTADHAVLVRVVGTSGWGLKEASKIIPHEDQLLVLPSPLASKPTSAELQEATIILVDRFEVQEVIEIEMAFPASTLLVSSTSPEGPYVVVFGKQPETSSLDNLHIMELSRCPDVLSQVFRGSPELQACYLSATAHKVV